MWGEGDGDGRRVIEVGLVGAGCLTHVQLSCTGKIQSVWKWWS